MEIFFKKKRTKTGVLDSFVVRLSDAADARNRAPIESIAYLTRDYLNESHAKLFIEHSVHDRVEHAREVAEPREHKIDSGLVRREPILDKLLAHSRQRVEHKKGTPQSYEQSEHDDEHFERLSLVVGHLLHVLLIACLVGFGFGGALLLLARTQH